MPRPQCCRRIAHSPICTVFTPAGVPACDLKEVVLTLDEFEAIRLADLEGLYQENAAARMNVSRQTFGRILEAGRRKVAQVLMEGQPLRIGGGEVEMSQGTTFKCPNCRRPWTPPATGDAPQGCPKCRNTDARSVDDEHQGGAAPTCKRHCHRHNRSK